MTNAQSILRDTHTDGITVYGIPAATAEALFAIAGITRGPHGEFIAAGARIAWEADEALKLAIEFVADNASV